jgi:hypothetical protein
MNDLPVEQRTLCPDFMDELKDGFLSPVRKRVAKDDTLMLSLRKKYFNIYYRGGSILKLTRGSNGVYKPFFDANFGESAPAVIASLPVKITSPSECDEWVSALSTLKEIMNGFFVNHPKAEREFQQLVAWENNRSAISNGTEYFITDIEFANEARDARFDMLGLKWCADKKKSGTQCAPVLIEMKWGDDAYAGAAGIKKHIEDIERLVGNEIEVANVRKTIGAQFQQLHKLGMLRFNLSSAVKEIAPLEPLEVVFILANHNPRSVKLHNILKTLEEPKTFALRFFVASFSGYGMHEACMLNLSQFKNLVASYLKTPDQPQVTPEAVQ